MIYNTKKIKDQAKKDFFTFWKNTENQFPKPNEEFKELLLKPTQPQPHPIPNLVAKIRSNFLRMGFREVENPLFIEEQDVYKQYGPEAPAILDRCYYLGGIPRPEVGLGDKKIAKIKNVVPNFSKEHITSLKEVMREYKLGRIEGDDLMETIEQKLGLSTEDSAKIISAFDELKNLTAEPTKITLRSHMTAGWFPTISALQDKMEHPIKLFSIGLRFRREQKIDATHLRAHYGASCAVCDPNMEVEAGKAIVAEVMKPLGFKDFTYIQKQATSTYYANNSEYEVFAKSGGDEIEIADLGMYSPIALSQYDIKYPTFNAGFGIERILMIKEKRPDVREVMFPQFYSTPDLSDSDIAKSIKIDKKPQTEDGKKLSKALAKTAIKNANANSPCEFEVLFGLFLGKSIVVKLHEKESGTKLLGPAALNDIYVYKGGIYGVPKEGFKEKAKTIKDNGINTKISYIEALSDYFAAEIENAVQNNKSYSHQFKMAKSAPEINVKIADHVLKFIQSKNKELMVKGPIFTAVEMELK